MKSQLTKIRLIVMGAMFIAFREMIRRTSGFIYLIYCCCPTFGTMSLLFDCMHLAVSLTLKRKVQAAGYQSCVDWLI